LSRTHWSEYGVGRQSAPPGFRDQRVRREVEVDLVQRESRYRSGLVDIQVELPVQDAVDLDDRQRVQRKAHGVVRVRVLVELDGTETRVVALLQWVVRGDPHDGAEDPGSGRRRTRALEEDGVGGEGSRSCAPSERKRS
jgi:hypothetical protein